MGSPGSYQILVARLQLFGISAAGLAAAGPERRSLSALRIIAAVDGADGAVEFHSEGKGGEVLTMGARSPHSFHRLTRTRRLFEITDEYAVPLTMTYLRR